MREWAYCSVAEGSARARTLHAVAPPCRPVPVPLDAPADGRAHRGVVALTTLFSYLNLLHSVRTESLARLERSVAEHGQREQGIFVLAQDNHAVLQKALAERIRELEHEDVDARFDALFAPLPDGTLRNRPERFDGTRMPGVFIPRGEADAELRRRILASYDVLAQYGPALHTRFTNTYVVLPEGVLVLLAGGPHLVPGRRAHLLIAGLEYYAEPAREQPGAADGLDAASTRMPSPGTGWSRSPRRWTWRAAMSRRSAMTCCSTS